MQPTYLPWAGYFNLISSVDKFIFLDDVQFERRSWQSRNKILLNGLEHLITIPIAKAPQKEKILDIKTSTDINWKKNHWDKILFAYKKSSYAKQLFEIIEDIYQDSSITMLGEFNRTIIEHVARTLSLETTFLMASSLNCGGTRSEHLIVLAESVGCDVYLSPVGSKEYLFEDNFVKSTKIKLEFQNYEPRFYKQYMAKTFISHLSIIDVIANCGIENAKKYIKG